MILKLDENDFSHGLVATYENAARKAGLCSVTLSPMILGM